MTDWSAIVLDLDGDAAMLRACVDSLLQQERAPRQVVLFDNGSSNPTGDRLTRRDSRIQHVRVPSNLGFARGMNEALAHVDSPFVALINNDAVLEAQWSSKVLDALTIDERTAAVQTVTLADDEHVDGAGVALIDGRIQQLGHGKRTGEVPLADFWGVSATAAMYRRAALDDVGRAGRVFRDDFITYYEDVELAARLRARGWTMRLVAEPLARHAGSATASRLGHRALHLRVRNRYFVARLHPEVASRISLLAEDTRRSLRSLLRFDPATSLRIAAAVVAGLLAPLER